MFKATDVLFSEDENVNQAYKPKDGNMVIFPTSGVKTLGKSIWKVIDENNNEFAAIFGGVIQFKDDKFEITLKGNLYDNSESKLPRNDYTPLLTIIGEHKVCQGCMLNVV